jgi:trans-4-hydroxy-L-proline dehydratase
LANADRDPKSVPTFPELTCHSVDDFHVLNSRDQQRYTIPQEDIDTYEREVIPYWKGRTMRERIFSHVPTEWKAAYEAGVFTEFMEQRAPGHTTLDGKIYRKGMLDFKKEIEDHIARLDFLNDPEATEKLEELKAMAISCDAAIVFAERHADLAEKLATTETNMQRAAELKKWPKFVAGFLHTHRKICGKPFKCTGLCTSAPLPNSTAGTP